ncbi:serine/threonine-protein kinase [Kitasatospora sp. A2-31]|uniref:serine/threonine-protein kinase n=1 Tax=Kitasatospora sp. A2-31 TaxID=2916414 RepID=UPI001EEBE952|nr:serine/threonine-protein kinase [Kitasatospora sp. A2-31]MCG6493874.1 serine/threonine protein kinase [Kitasatospora sp. A2-31]
MAAAVGGTAGEEAREGLVIADRYRLVRRLGAGGFGQVWQAADTVLHVDVAVKQVWLAPAMDAAETGERLLRAQREARSAARLRDHPHVVAVHDVVVADGVPWTVMQLVAGSSLADRLEAGGPLAPEQAARIATAMLSALGAAHAAGIVHRDVKPANIMLADDGQILLTDFGIALRHEETALTVSGAVIGSVEYMAPERIQGEGDGPAGDLFSLGVALYQAVEGRSPFRRATPTASLLATVSEEAPPLRHTGTLATVIRGLMVKDPRQRLTVEAATALLAGPAAAAVPRPATATATAPPPAVGSEAPTHVIAAHPTGPAVPAPTTPFTVLDASPVRTPAPTPAAAAAAAAPNASGPGTAAPGVPAPEVPEAAPGSRPRRRWGVITASLVAGATALGVAFAVPYFSQTGEIESKLLQKNDLPAGYRNDWGAGDMGYLKPVSGTWPCAARSRQVVWKHSQDDTVEYIRDGSDTSTRYGFNEGLRKVDPATAARHLQAVRDEIAECASFTVDLKTGRTSMRCEIAVTALPAPQAPGLDIVGRRETLTCSEDGSPYAPAVVEKFTAARGGYLVEFFATDSHPFPPAEETSALMTTALRKLS